MDRFDADCTAADYALRSKVFWYPEWNALLAKHNMYLSDPRATEWSRR